MVVAGSGVCSGFGAGAAAAADRGADRLAGSGRTTGAVGAASKPSKASATGATLGVADDFDGWLAARIAPEDVGLIALPVSGGPPLIAHNASVPMNPASTMKLLTTYAALATLGPGYRWKTDAYLRGRLDGDVLNGDLILKGGGDPKLVIEDLTEFITAMRRAGLRELRGDLVIDDSVFDVGESSVENFDGDPTQPYNVRPFGLLMNFKATRIVVRPGDAGASVTLDPALDGVEVVSRLRLLRGPCRAGSTALAIHEVDASAPPAGKALPQRAMQRTGAARGPTGAAQGSRAATGAGVTTDSDVAPSIVVTGTYSPSCGEQGLFASVLTHREFIHALFRAAWLAAGGQWTGRTRIERGAAVGTPWLEWESPRTLADVVNDVNKFSNNVMARQLLLTLAAQAGDSPATVEAARSALVGWLSAQGLALPGLVIDNGAGLSRIGRISADGLAHLLVHAAASPFAETLRSSLPVVGVDGTMKYRMSGERIVGHAWIKTGSLEGVRAIAGYVDGASGRRYAVALFCQGARGEASAALQESFLRWVHARG